MKYIRETAAAKSLSAYVIFKGDIYIGKVLSHHTEQACKVEVWSNFELIHTGRATGYGYDMYTKALSGAVIDGHEISDHCQIQLATPAEGGWDGDFKLTGYWAGNFKDSLYRSCYKMPGLGYLKDIGYTVIQVL